MLTCTHAHMLTCSHAHRHSMRSCTPAHMHTAQRHTCLHAHMHTCGHDSCLMPGLHKNVLKQLPQICLSICVCVCCPRPTQTNLMQISKTSLSCLFLLPIHPGTPQAYAESLTGCQLHGFFMASPRHRSPSRKMLGKQRNTNMCTQAHMLLCTRAYIHAYIRISICACTDTCILIVSTGFEVFSTGQDCELVPLGKR